MDFLEVSVCVDDLCEMRDVADVRVETLPGILMEFSSPG